MKGLIKLREELHYRVLIFRSIENIVIRPRFTRLWLDSNREKKEEAIELIKLGDKAGIQNWIKNHPSLDLGEKTLTHLRIIGKKIRVKYYARLTQSELISAIIDKERQDVTD